MNRIKSFDEYIKEELSPDTYVDIAKKTKGYSGKLGKEILQHASTMRGHEKADKRPQWVRELEDYIENDNNHPRTLLPEAGGAPIGFSGKADGKVILTPKDGDINCSVKKNHSITIYINGMFQGDDGKDVPFDSVVFHGMVPRKIARIIFNNTVCRGRQSSNPQSWRELWDQQT